MSNPRKFFAKGAVLFITASTETGLPFVPNIIINTILRGIIARAQKLYGQEICHLLFMANHFHLILRVTDPALVSDFIGYIKGKSADGINRLLGRRKQTVWCDGFDSPLLLDANATIDKIVYTYANPSKARLVDSIYEYPGISSWRAFTQGSSAKLVSWIRPSTIKALPCFKITLAAQLKYLAKLRRMNKISYRLTYNTDSWMLSFRELNEEMPEEINKNITMKVKLLEEEYAKGEKTMGAAKQKMQALNVAHIRRKVGRRMICICKNKERRIRFVSWFKAMSAQAAEDLRNYIYLNIHKPLPPGFFAPGKILHANFIDFMDWVYA